MKLNITIILLFIISSVIFGQNDNRDYRVEVLKKDIIGKEFTFGKWNEEVTSETRLKYLGTVKTEKGKVYKIMNSIWIWGLSKRATNRILIFNQKNQYLGNYYITMINELPTKVKNGYLIFKNIDTDCDKNIETKINFKYGIPRTIFRKCNNESGEEYSFEE
ncbi:hypothetical protein [Flavobacterium undicola]|uniref:hypothetical protein n=1 Tax=Flavobacterium undicola TaxID=1932779 RepID=UPI00137867F2|nr:hypothetical protein [Flavobacterium undicola]MBA0883911.1 hypothetical protein [Flavobacterium undicola]